MVAFAGRPDSIVSAGIQFCGGRGSRRVRREDKMKRSTDRNVPLSDYTILGVGGSAALLVRAASAGDLIVLLADVVTESTNVLLLAGGSNVLISDAAFDGLVIKPTCSEGTEAQLPDGSLLLV